MPGKLLVDLLVDRLRGAGVPDPRGTRSSPYDPLADRSETARLISTYETAWEQSPWKTDEERTRLTRAIVGHLAAEAGLALDDRLESDLARTLHHILIEEPAFIPRDLPDPHDLSFVELDDLASDLRHRITVLTSSEHCDAAIRLLCALLDTLFEALPQAIASDQSRPSAQITIPLIALVREPHDLMTRLLGQFISNRDVTERRLFDGLSRQLYANILEASGVVIDPARNLLEYDFADPTLPVHCQSESAQDVARRYFARTPLLDLLTTEVPFTIPEATRFEHMHILAGTGHGKTQAMQHLIVADLMRPNAQVPAIVILDSQGDMIRTLTRLERFDPLVQGSLAERVLIVDPSDVAFPPALNLFDIHSHRLAAYSQKDREQVLAGIIEIYDYIFGGLLGAELTQKQAMVFRFLAQLMLAIPGSTIHTLHDLLKDAAPYMDAIQSLPPIARGFFEDQFFTKAYAPTREQILRRLYGVLQNPAFERMFANARNRLDLFEVLNKGGIVFVNTAKDFLKSEASSIFGRYMIALTLKAAFERATLPPEARRPTFLWIDEASEYFDDQIDSLLIQARKYKLGLIMAHQYLGQLSRSLPASIMTNTSIKLAGGISDKDARQLAPEMRTRPEFLTAMRKEGDRTHFAAFVRNLTSQAVPISIPFGTAEGMASMSEETFEVLLNASRQRLAVQPKVALSAQSSPAAHETPRDDSDPADVWEEY